MPAATKSHCTKGHPYTPENTYHRKDRRECRTCRADRNRRDQTGRKTGRLVADTRTGQLCEWRVLSPRQRRALRKQQGDLESLRYETELRNARQDEIDAERVSVNLQPWLYPKEHWGNDFLRHSLKYPELCEMDLAEYYEVVRRALAGDDSYTSL